MQPQVYQFTFAMLTLNWKDADATPPPFTLLKPVTQIVLRVIRCIPCFKSYELLKEEDNSPANASPLRLRHMKSSADTGKEVQQSAHALRLQVDTYMAEHADEADALDRWRLRLTKAMSKQDREIVAIAEKTDQLDEKLKTVIALLERQAGVVIAGGEPMPVKAQVSTKKSIINQMGDTVHGVGAALTGGKAKLRDSEVSGSYLPTN
jgi:hypothetical protein